MASVDLSVLLDVAIEFGQGDDLSCQPGSGSVGGSPANHWYGVPRPVPLRQLPPWRAGALHPANRVDP